MALPRPPNNLVALADKSETQRKRLQDRERADILDNATAWLTVDAARGPRKGMR